MITLAALVVGSGLLIVVGMAVWASIRRGICREPRWSVILHTRNPTLRGSVYFGIGLMCGSVVAAGAFLIVDLICNQPGLWVRQLRGLLVTSASLAVGGLLAAGLLQLEHFRGKRSPPGK